MKETRYGLQVTVAAPYDAAVQRATEALKGEGFGVLTTIDVQQTLRTKLNREFRKLTAPAQTCATTADLGRAAEIMLEHNCGCLPVVDSHGHVAGIITDRDICIEVAARHKSPWSIPVREAMTRTVSRARRPTTSAWRWMRWRSITSGVYP